VRLQGRATREIFLIIASFGLATCLPTASAKATSAHEYDYIAKVQITDDGYLYINCPGNCVNDDNCPSSPPALGPFYAVSKYPLSDDRTRAQLQVALASFLSHQKVYVVTTGCRNDGRLLLDSIQLEQQ
jgi:hypothetical protein